MFLLKHTIALHQQVTVWCIFCSSPATAPPGRSLSLRRFVFSPVTVPSHL